MRFSYIFPAVIIGAFVSQAWAIESGDTATIRRNYIAFNPIALVVGEVNANYERVNGHSGLLVEGLYTVPLLGTESYGGTLAWRYHFRQTGLGGFIGPFLKIGHLESKIKDESGDTYKYKFDYTTLGLAIGKRSSLGKKHRLHYTIRIGLGYPVKNDWAWNTPPPETINGVSTDFFKTMASIPAYFDSELSLSFGF